MNMNAPDNARISLLNLTTPSSSLGQVSRSTVGELVDEAISIIREVTAECEQPVLLFSGGKDSAVLLQLAIAAFAPARLPFPIMHVDTAHNFPEVYEYRDSLVDELGLRLVVASVQESIDTGRVVEETGPRASRNRLQSVTLLDAIATHKFDAAFGGGRRDEDRARAKERILSFRDATGGWDPRRQRPEPWDVLNARIRKGEHLRAFPLSNWTELDIWSHIASTGLQLPSIYFAHQREVVKRNGMLLSLGGPVTLEAGETSFVETVRYRTVGDMSCTGAVRSDAVDVHTIVDEVAAARITERGATRADDATSESAMEDRKREGYF
jgi:sulfate adenylyltransferase subunit 2